MFRTMWWTPIKGFLDTAANVFAAFNPTGRQGGNPGPLVTAIASRSCTNSPARSNVSQMTPGKLREWPLLARVGTMPPIGSCNSCCPRTTSAKIFLSEVTIAADVSSHEVSMPSTLIGLVHVVKNRLDEQPIARIMLIVVWCNARKEKCLEPLLTTKKDKNISCD